MGYRNKAHINVCATEDWFGLFPPSWDVAKICINVLIVLKSFEDLYSGVSK